MHILTFSKRLGFVTAAFPVTEAGPEPSRRNCSASAAAACTSGTLCTHIKTSLQECVHGSAFKTGGYCHLLKTLLCANPPTWTHAHADVYLSVSCHTLHILMPLQVPRFSRSALLLAPEKKLRDVSTQLKLWHRIIEQREDVLLQKLI